MKRATMMLFAIAMLSGCGGDPQPKPEPRVESPPAKAGGGTPTPSASPPAPGEEPVEVPRPGSRAAFIYTWREQLAPELPSGDPKAPWKLGDASFVKTTGGQDGWDCAYFLKPGDPQRLKVSVIEYVSIGARDETLAKIRADLASRGVDRAMAIDGAIGRAVETPSVKAGVAKTVHVLAAIGVDRWLFLFDRPLDDAAKLDDAKPLDAATVRAFVDAVLPGKLAPAPKAGGN